MYRREKAQKQLEAVQKGCTARLMTITDVEKYVMRAEEVLSEMNVPREAIKYVSFEAHDTVANAYNNRAKGTRLTLTFTLKGKVKDVLITRDTIPCEAYGGMVERFKLDEKWVEAFGLNWDDHNRAANLLLKSFGFNSQHTHILHR